MKKDKEPKTNSRFVKFICVCLFLTAFSVVGIVLSFKDRFSDDFNMQPWHWRVLSVFFFSTIAVLITTFFVSRNKKLRASQKEVGQAKVIAKRKEVMRRTSGPHHITFELPDGSNKEISLGVGDTLRKNLDCIVVNDIGTLVYQELNGCPKFISFESDNYKEKVKLSFYDKLYNTYIGSLLVMFSACFMCGVIPAIFIVTLLNDFYKSLLSFNKWLVILLILLQAVIILTVFYIPKIVVYCKLKNMAEKSERVKVLESGEAFPNESDITAYVTIFEFSDGSRKCFTINSKHCEAFPAVDDTGTLTYKELGNDVRFVRFEK